MAQLPPIYRDHFTPPAQSTTSLPAYTRSSRPSTARQPSTEHTFELRRKKGAPWATLKIRSRARAPEQLPVFLEGDCINGSLGLSLGQPDHILSVSVSGDASYHTSNNPLSWPYRWALAVGEGPSPHVYTLPDVKPSEIWQVIGQIITGNRPEDVFSFLDTSWNLWAQDMGEPRSPLAIALHSPCITSKLYGDHSWPISFPLPKEVLVPASGKRSVAGSGSSLRSFQLPQTFSERHTRASILYNLIVNINRTAFRAGSKLQTMFVYVPVIQPGPPSMLRQIAYQEGTPLPSPTTDPEGWCTLSTVSVKGRIFSSREVVLECTLSLAKPLSYTRGSIIPCFLTIRCPDEQTLHHLSTPHAVAVCLYRRVKFIEALPYAQIQDNQLIHQDSAEEISMAAWWPHAHDGSESTEDGPRKLYGEIPLAKNLKSSCVISHFSVDYSVVVLPFRATAFTPSSTRPLLEQSVEVATMFARGPRPRIYTPPEYNE